VVSGSRENGVRIKSSDAFVRSIRAIRTILSSKVLDGMRPAMTSELERIVYVPGGPCQFVYVCREFAASPNDSTCLRAMFSVCPATERAISA